MVSTSFRKFFSFVFLFSLISTWALAVENFKVPVAKLRVYSQPSTLSNVITTLTQGQVVQAGSNPAGGFKKVLVADSTGKKKIGYIALADLPAAARAATTTKATPSQRSGKGNHAFRFGLQGGVAYDSGTRNITDQNGNSVSTSSLTGTNPEYGAHIIYPWSQKFLIEGDLGYKSTTVTGTYTPLGASTTASVTINQNFFSAGLQGRYYFNPTGSFWIGPGVQLDWGTSATATLGAVTSTLSTNQFVYLYAGLGYDFGITDSIFFTPIVRVGGDVNASPIILEGNALAALDFKF